MEVMCWDDGKKEELERGCHCGTDTGGHELGDPSRLLLPGRCQFECCLSHPESQQAAHTVVGDITREVDH